MPGNIKYPNIKAIGIVLGGDGSPIDNGTADGQLLFWDSVSTKWIHTEQNELYWDDSNKRLGIGLNTPSTSLHISKTDGITLGDGNDTDQDLITVDVTGSPRIWWNELTDSFEFNKSLTIPGGSLKIGGITLTEDDGCLRTSDFHAHGDSGIAGYFKLHQGTTPLADAELEHSILWADSNDLYIQKADGTDEKIIKQTGGGITVSETGIQASVFSSDSDSYVFIRSGYDGLGTEKSGLIFNDNTNHKWRLEKDDSNNFALYDNARAANVLKVVGNGNMTLMGSGGKVGIGSTTAPSALLTLYHDDVGGAFQVCDSLDVLRIRYDTNYDIILKNPGGADTVKIANNGASYFNGGDVSISALAGTGNAAVYVNSAGQLYRGATV